MYTIYLVFLGVIGAIFGSFICCQVRRLRAAEKGKRVKSKTSVCMNCGEKLKWYDNIPVVSWVMLGGKCRKCGKKIGYLEIVAEVAGIIGFVLIGDWYGNPFGFDVWKWVLVILNLVFYCFVLLISLYDAEYGEMPEGALYGALGVGFSMAVINVVFYGAEIWSVALAVAILGGTYFLLYKISNERLVGSGDWLLGTAIALALGDWVLGLFVMFVSNLLATVVMVPVMMVRTSRRHEKRRKKGTKIYFGPWMAVGYMVVFVLSSVIVALL